MTTFIFVLLALVLVLLVATLFYTIGMCKDMERRIKRLYRYQDTRYDHMEYEMDELKHQLNSLKIKRLVNLDGGIPHEH